MLWDLLRGIRSLGAAQSDGGRIAETAESRRPAPDAGSRSDPHPAVPFVGPKLSIALVSTPLSCYFFNEARN